MKELPGIFPSSVASWARDSGSAEGQNQVTLLENFFDEVRRKVPAGK
jgi:hypothetical protein